MVYGAGAEKAAVLNQCSGVWFAIVTSEPLVTFGYCVPKPYWLMVLGAVRRREVRSRTARCWKAASRPRIPSAKRFMWAPKRFAPANWQRVDYRGDEAVRQVVRRQRPLDAEVRVIAEAVRRPTGTGLGLPDVVDRFRPLIARRQHQAARKLLRKFHQQRVVAGTAPGVWPLRVTVSNSGNGRSRRCSGNCAVARLPPVIKPKNGLFTRASSCVPSAKGRSAAGCR